jgi:LysM repeat protein
LGAHSKPSRVRLPQATAGAAVPTLAGVAAAICLSPQTPAAAAVLPATATVPSSGAATSAAAAHKVPAAYRPAPDKARLLAARGARHKQAPAASTYTVRPGDSLSAIAGRVYHNPAAWPVLYWQNHDQVRWADIITSGQVLTIPARPGAIPAPPAQLAPAPAYTPRHATPAVTTADQADATPAPAAVPAAPAAPAASWSGTYPGGAFGACVVARESGGNPQIWNPSGHWGLYQFSYSTWVAYGGNPASFGNAGVAEQNAVFATALARGGQSNWSPYDGC